MFLSESSPCHTPPPRIDLEIHLACDRFASMHAYLTLHILLANQKSVFQLRKGRKGEMKEGGDTFEKVVWSDTREYEVRHFVKEKARGEGDEAVKDADRCQ